MTTIDPDTLPLDLSTRNYAISATRTLEQVIESLEDAELSTSVELAFGELTIPVPGTLWQLISSGGSLGRL